MGAVINKNQPAGWDDLSQYDLSCVNGDIIREPTVETAYTIHKRNLYEQGISLSEYVREHILRDRTYILEKNKFPYWVESDIQHYVFWMKPGHKLPMYIIKEKLEKELRTNVIIYENTPSSQSVASIPHYHVFINTDNI